MIVYMMWNSQLTPFKEKYYEYFDRTVLRTIAREPSQTRPSYFTNSYWRWHSIRLTRRAP